MQLTYRRAKYEDLEGIISLLVDDPLGKTRELGADISGYSHAFAWIDSDSNQYLMVVEQGQQLVGTCHLTLMPSLTFQGSTRLQIEAVRVRRCDRGQGFGEQMIGFAIAWGQERGVKMVQLMTDKTRTEALRFYEKLGFKASHQGMKLHL